MKRLFPYIIILIFTYSAQAQLSGVKVYGDGQRLAPHDTIYSLIDSVKIEFKNGQDEVVKGVAILKKGSKELKKMPFDHNEFRLKKLYKNFKDDDGLKLLIEVDRISKFNKYGDYISQQDVVIHVQVLLSNPIKNPFSASKGKK